MEVEVEVVGYCPLEVGVCSGAVVHGNRRRCQRHHHRNIVTAHLGVTEAGDRRRT